MKDHEDILRKVTAAVGQAIDHEGLEEDLRQYVDEIVEVNYGKPGQIEIIGEKGDKFFDIYVRIDAIDMGRDDYE
jgi:hypothetical protein